MSNRFDEIYDWAGLRVRDYVLTHYDANARIMDVGAGQGKYRILLPTYVAVDACEIWEPTVESEHLRDMYREVLVRDFADVVRSPDWTDRDYDLVVMGDVLEHMTRSDAQLVVDDVLAVGTDLVVVVPYEYPQDEEDGNVYQRHIQDDLTPERMAVEYPRLRLVALETRDWRPFKGIYVGRASE